MSGSDFVAEARRWLQFAHDDADAARALANTGNAKPRHVCWHWQQAAEKAIKAALILDGIVFPRTHDLDTLADLLPDRWERDALPELGELSQWAVESRYPGLWDEPTRDDDAFAFRFAKRCRSFFVIHRDHGKRTVIGFGVPK